MDNDNAKGTAALGSIFTTRWHRNRQRFAKFQHVSRLEVSYCRPCDNIVTLWTLQVYIYARQSWKRLFKSPLHGKQRDEKAVWRLFSIFL